MVEIQAGAKYILTNSLIGSTKGLASTSANDSVVVVPLDSNDSQSWYFLETNTPSYYRLYTQQKGDFAALDVYNYNGKNTIDLHMFAVHEATGQYWYLNNQDDGSVKISNQFTGPDMYLDIVRDTLQPTLAAKDGPGQRWILSQVGSSPTATPSGARNATASVTNTTMTPAGTSGINTSSATGAADSSSSSGLSKKAIGGIAAGSAVGLIAVAIGAFLIWRRRRARYQPVLQGPQQISSRQMLNVP